MTGQFTWQAAKLADVQGLSEVDLAKASQRLVTHESLIQLIRKEESCKHLVLLLSQAMQKHLQEVTLPEAKPALGCAVREIQNIVNCLVFLLDDVAACGDRVSMIRC